MQTLEQKMFLAWRTWPHVIAGTCVETKYARCTTFQFSVLSAPSKIFSLCKMVIQILLPIFRFQMKIETLGTTPKSCILRFQRQTVPWDINISLGSRIFFFPQSFIYLFFFYFFFYSIYILRIFILVCSVNRYFTSWRKQRECSDYYD